MFEKVERGSLSELLASVGDTKLKGEYIVVIAGVGKGEKKEVEIQEDDNDNNEI